RLAAKMPDGIVSSFTFITTDSRRKAAREAVKVHVLRLRRNKRKRNGGSCKSRHDDANRGGQMHLWDSTVPQVPDPSPWSSAITESDHSDSAESLDATIAESRYSSSLDFEGPASSPIRRQREPCPITSMHVPAVSPEDVLIHCYIEEDPGCGITPVWLQCFKTSEASYNAFLAASSFRFSVERGVQPLADAPEREIRALQAIAKQIELSPTTPTAGTMLAVALLMNLQEYRGETSLAVRHWKGLQSMVEVSGGLHCLRIWAELHNFLFWVDVLICNALSVPLGRISSDDDPDQTLGTQELHALLTQISQQPSTLTPNADTGAGGDGDGYFSPLFQVLQRSSPDQSTTGVAKSSRAKLACLMYISLLELHFHKPRAKIPIYQEIEEEVLRRGRDRVIHTVELLYVILSMSNQDSLCHLVYKLSRVMNAAKKLERSDYNICARLLSAYLGHRNPFE
ncbi:uncharacterized protein A1O9_05914, partial [Exophiala aquamarina CBS 119918]